ncbi:MAG: hypothetical protein M0Q53_06810 [Prolixibacteraceae bacterium]|jgi:hypothetical protein|nr:hypothetical protein [Prolixibacteraceae bacterium]
MRKLHLLTLLLFFTFSLSAQITDLSKATIIASKNIPSTVRETAIRVLKEEIFQRTSIQLKEVEKIGAQPVVAMVLSSEKELGGIKVPANNSDLKPENKPEGYRLVVDESNGRKILWLIAADQRGTIFSIGQLLRTAGLSRGKFLFDKKNEIATSPKYPIRGHQIGYRNTANSWDSWTMEQYEKYLRELALFGTNSIENIPFHDGKNNPLMKYPRDVMNIKIAEICHEYGLDHWDWIPADVDLSDPVKFKEEVARHEEYYKNCPYLDGVFFPGGDPGSNHPKDVMPFLKAVTERLKKYHPKATMWISLQGFSDEQVDYFYQYLETNQPDWLTGVVTGPSSPDLAATRFRLPKKYMHRHYPDLTHTVRCQYPTLNWDQAFALTEGREVCNPQPVYYAKIHNRFAPFTDGFLSYSDGCHDDINKVTWSQMAWDPTRPVRNLLVEYARFFFGNAVAEAGADGILSLERNWVGPTEENGGIETTYSFWKNLENQHPELNKNWRWQMLLMRSNYDVFVKRRKAYEQKLEKEANEILLKAPLLGSEKSMNMAMELVNKGDKVPVTGDLRTRIVELCESLWQSIGLQTSVKKYMASGSERGAILDFIDYPLNNRWWLADEFKKIEKMATEKEKLARLEVIAKWENPGPGSYYDNVSDISKSCHVLTVSDDGTDVAWWEGGLSRRRLSTQLFQNFPVLKYNDLDPNGSYLIRVAGYREALLRVDGERVEPTIYNKGYEEFKEFPLNPKYVSDGMIDVTFDQPEESTLNWRERSKVTDVWLIKLK